jgi:hypothetical protein
MGMGRKKSVLKMKRRKGQAKKKARILRRKAAGKSN